MRERLKTALSQRLDAFVETVPNPSKPKQIRKSFGSAAYFGECDRSFRRIVTDGLRGDFSAVSVT